MVAVVSGNGLGLFDSSFDRLGVAMGGRDRLGAGAGAHFVNAATGNLVLQGHDESLLGRGMPLSLLRTYNSQGLQAGADGWMHGFEQTLVFEGTSKSAPVARVFRGDGSSTAFQWDATRGLYVSTDGAGAHDTIEATNGGWVLVEGSTRGESRFDADGRLVAMRDGRTGTTAAMVYAKDGSGRLAEVQVDGGDALVFGYDASGRLANVSTREGGVLRSQVRYDYDALGRLTHVHADLTPDDAGDARWSTTRYTYEGSSLRVLRMEQGDGTVSSYTWHADGRVRSVTVGDVNDNDGDGAGRTTFFTYDAAGRTTHVADSAGRTWSYEWNADGQLGRVLAPAVDGQRAATRYEYDTQGNLSAVTDAAGRRTVFGYDAWGNRILERDAAGGTVQRTFDARQQVLTETRFTVADPDGAGPGQPSGALTTRYVYDTQARLRFIIDATGGVQEMRYASSGSGVGQLASTHAYTATRYAIGGLAANASPALATMEAWASGQRAASTRVDLAYDVAGRLASRTAYARVDGNGVGVFDAATEATTYLYDAQGLLRRQDTLRGENRQVVDRTSFAYDGLGRLLSTVDASGAITTYAWDDAGRRLVVTTAGGLVRTEVRNAAGELLTTTESTTGGLQGRVMQHYYDTQGRLVAVEDAAGGRHYTFHDAAGRVVGEVDATGAFVERVYDAAGQLVERRAYDRNVATAGWVVGGAVVLPTLASVRASATGDAAAIRRATYSYDGAGRLATERDGVGLETRYRYDAAGRLLQTTQVDTAAAGAPTRTTRILLDADGRRVGQLDAEGYLQEWTYDAAGRMVLSVRYATRSPASALAEGDLAALRPQAAAGDQRERFFFDGRGRQVASLDAEGYLVEYLHDDAGRLRTERAYARRLTGLTGGESLSNLVQAAVGGGMRELRHVHDAMGRLATSLDHEGTTTRYTYDIDGRLVRTERAVGTSEIRENRLRYNALGQLIGELDAMAATRVLPGMSEAQLDQIYAQWGTVHRYDALGRRVESTDPDGHKTWYVHDASGRLTHTIRGVVSEAGVLNALGEVERTDYNAFGEAVASTRYAGRIATSQLATLAQALAAIASAEQDATISRTYTAQGRVATETGPLGHTTRWTYSAFGDVLTETRPLAGERALLIEHGYDRRGLRTSSMLDRAGIEASELLQLDAFGRVRVRTDALGASTTFAYDRLGRQVSSTLVVGGRGEVVSQAYDAWGRTLEQVDAMGRRTEYLYDDALRTVTVRTPEGVTMTTARNRHGETVSLTDAAGQATRYEYNARGQVVAVTAADQGREERTYDDRGLLLRETDASGRAVEYRYDALGRTLQRIEDPDGLALATRYRYDTAGRQVEVRDASGRLTRFTYDQAGQLVEQALDPSGLNLRTRFTWDPEGRQLTMTEGFGTAAARTVAYGYDVLGRRTSEVVAPGVLDLTTRYEYDDAGQLRRSIDAEGRATRYTYDEAGRLVHTIDPAGTVTRRWYDAVGREVASRTYAAVSVSAKLEAPTVGDIDALLPTTASAADPVGYRIHDRDGRLRFAIDALGHVTEIRYDALGRAHQQLAYALPLALSTADQQALRAGELAPDTLATRLAGQAGTARARFSTFDAVGRVRFEVVRQDLGQGSVGVVTERRYDAAGRVIASIAHATTVAWSPSLDTAALQQAITAAGGNAASQQRVTRMHHDGAGRVRYTVDDAGVVTAMAYDAAGRIEAIHAYTAPIADPAAADAAAVEAALAGLGRRTTRYEYDNAGRQTDVVDALGRRERFGYDASGKRTSYTDRNNATWNYHYDAAGRLEHEDSPAVAVARYDAAGVLRESVQRIRTTIGYDRVGNVVERTENAGTAEARTTRYEYDARGRQVRTVFPDPGRYDRATGALVATGQAPSVTVTYDALDRAVVQTDTLGQHAYRVFDAAGRLVYEIDEGGYVTRHTYNAFGDREGMVRYARAITVPAGERGLPKDAAWIAARLVPEAGDRTITTRYDGAGRRTSVEESAVSFVRADGSTAVGSPRTEFRYNVHGEVIRESVLIDGTSGQANARWAHTHHVHDELGRRVMTVDAEGYVTEFEYTANGELARQIEYARAIAVESVVPGVRPAPPPSGDAQTGFDRIQRFEHDALGRVVFQRVDRRFENTDGSSGVREVVTEQRYDGEGRVIEQVVDGQLTRTAYDALGRSVSLRESERAVLRDDAQALLQASPGLDLASASLYRQSSPFTSMRYDAFGNVLEVRRSATGWLQGQATPPAAAAGDQVMSYRLDWQGRVVAERNAAGIAQFHEYDAADRRTLTTYQLAGAGDAVANAGVWVESRASYDALGRQQRVEVSRRLSNDTVEIDQVVSAEHNAFGEIVYRGDGRPRGTPGAGATYVYDGAGRLVSSDAEGGSWRNYGYDLAGRQRTREVWVNVGSGPRQIVLAQDLDRLGRTLREELAPHADINGPRASVLRRFDRWGNVVLLVDARGYETRFAYNEDNQVIRETKPLVKVLGEDGVESWQRPEQRWYFDALGRLVGTRDANGNVRRMTHDAAGRATVAFDAYGNPTRTAYDALGQARLTQDARGYITFRDFDAVGRVVGHGDLVANASGTSRRRTVLESYQLNQNGDRIGVTNALSQTHRYVYDSRGLVLRSQTAAGVVMTQAYDSQGQRIRETNGLRALTASSLVDRDGETVWRDEQTWDYDYFGRLIDHNDLAGRDYDYTYDPQSGQRLRETTQLAGAASLDRSTTWYANGRVAQIVEGANRFRYEYDAAGNRTLEESTTRDGIGTEVRIRTQSYYDSHNRLVRVVQDDLVTGKRVFDLSYDYDAVGNRRRVVAQTGYGTGTSPVPVANRAPEVIAVPDGRTLRAGRPAEFRIRLTDVFLDPEYDALQIGVAQVVGGHASGLPAWLTHAIDPATGELVFTAGPGSSAALGQQLTLRLTATDTAQQSASVEFSLRVVFNSAPQSSLQGPAQFVVKTGRPFTAEFPAELYFRDLDVGDRLRIDVLAVFPPAPWLSIDNSNAAVARISGTPSAAQAGTYTVTLRARDEEGDGASRTVTLNVRANGAPTVVATPPAQEATLERAYELAMPLSSLFVDPDGDAMQVTASLEDGSALPAWLSFQFLNDRADPLLRLGGRVPADEVAGRTYRIRLLATDSDGASRSVVVSLALFANRAPVVVATPVVPAPRVNVDYRVELPISALFRDPDGDPLLLDLLHPGGFAATGWLRMTIDQAAGTVVLSGRPTSNTNHAGPRTVEIRARDADGLQVLLPLTLQVRGDTAPTFPMAPPDRNIGIGRSFSFTVPAATDADGDTLSYRAQMVVRERAETVPPTWVDTYVPLPSWLQFNSATRTFSGVAPLQTTAEPIRIRVLAMDGVNQAEAGFTVSIVQASNSGPVAEFPLAPRAALEGANVAWALPEGAFSDPDGDPLAYSAQVLMPAHRRLQWVNGVQVPVDVPAQWVALSTVGLSINASTGAISGAVRGLEFEDAGQPAFSGSLLIQVRAADTAGLAAFSVFTATVDLRPRGPTSSSHTIAIGETFSYRIPGFVDPEGSALAFSARLQGGGALPSWLALSADGVLTGRATVPGTVVIELTVTDASGLTSTSLLTLVAANQPPVYAGGLSPQAATPGQPFSYQVPAGAFTDPNGDPLTYTATLSSGAPLPAWLSFNAGTRTFSGTPGVAGSWTVRVSASDGASSASGTFTITVSNSAPVNAVPLPNRSGGQGAAVVWDLPAGAFTDPNGDPLSYALEVERPGYWEYFEIRPGEPDARWVPAAWEAASSVGLAINATTGRITGTPGLMWVPNGAPGGYDTLSTYRMRVVARDPAGASAAGEFTVGLNRPPVGPTALSQTVGLNANFSVQLTGFSDPDGQALTWSAAGLPAGVSLSASGVLSGRLTTPGSRTFTVTVTDTGGLTASATMTLVVGNTAPTYAGGLPASLTPAFGASFSWQVPAGAFTDPNGDALTYSMNQLVETPIWDGETNQWWTLVEERPLPAWLSFNASTRTLTGTPPNATTLRLQVIATDPGGLRGVREVLLAPSNGAPVVVAPPPNQTATRGASYSWQVPAGTFADPNGDPLTWSATGLPPGLAFTPSTRVISGVPTTQGSWTVTLSVSDGRGGSASTTFTLSVGAPANQAPVVVTPPPAQAANLGQPWSWMLPAGTFSDPDGDLLTYSASGMPAWMSFNASTRAFGGTPTAPGSWTITVTASDGRGGSISTTFTVVVVNPAPVYVGGLTARAATPGQPFSYQVPAGAFTDPNGDPLTYTATLSSGAPLPAWLSFNAGTRTFSGTPGVAGSWTVRVSASDGASSASGTFTITVSNSAPVNAVPLPNRSGGQGAAVVWDLPAGAFTDPNGDPLSYALEVERPGYWEYFEIRPGEPDARWVPAAWEAASSVGLAINATTGRITGTPGLMWVPNGAPGGYDTLSTYRMRVVARDPAGASAAGEFTVGLNRPPVGPTALSQTVGLNANFSVQLTGFSDPDGQALTWSAAGLPAGVSLSASGVLSGRLTTPGSRTFTVTVTDTGGLTASATMTLVVGNTAPTYAGGLPASLTPAFGASFSWQVPAGAFTDPNGDALTYSMNQLVETPIWDGETNQWWTLVEERPLPAWLSFNASTRTLTGTPPNATTLRLQVIATDPGGLRGVREVLLAPSNGAPVVVAPPPNQTATRGASYSWQVPAGTFADPNGDPLTWSATGLPPGLTFTPSTRVISGVPTTQGSWTVTLSVSDGRGGSASTTFTLSVGAPANQAPVVVTPPPNQTATLGSVFTWQVPAGMFADGDGDPLTWSATNLPPGLTFSPSTRVISGVPTTQGSWTVTLSVSDGRGGSASASFTLTVGAAANQQPVVVVPPPAQSATVGQPWSWTLPAGTFTDPDGDALAYTASGMPVWMSFNASSRAFSGTPTAAGTSTVTVTASDGRGGSVSTTFTVTVAAAPTNRPPVVVNPWGTFGATVGDYLDFTIAGIFSDPDGQTLTFGQSGKPGWLTFTPATGRFHGTVPQFAAWRSFYVTITATDPGGLSASSAFEIYVEGDGDIPRFIQRVGDGEVLATASAAPVEQQAPALASKRQVFTLASAAVPAAATASKLERSVIVEPLPMPAPAVRDWEEITPIDPVTPIEHASGTTVRRTESWFTYDRENRVQVSNGQLRNGQIVVEQGDYRSFALSYDAVGNQIAKQSWVQTAANTWTLQITQSTYTLRGELQSVFEPRAIDATSVGVSEARTYDDAGRLIERRSYFGSQVTFQYVDREGTSYPINVGGWLETAETYAYDADGRLLRQVSMSRPEETVRRYPFGSSTPVDIPVWLVGRGEDWGNAADQRTDLAVLTRRATVSYEASATTGYDAAGRVRGYTYTAPGYTHTYRYEYEARDSYLEKRVSGTSTDSRYKPTSTTLSYDAAGRQMLLRERIEYGDLKDQLRAFAYNGDGQIVSRRDGSIDRNTVINDGQQVMPPGFDQGSGEVALMNNHAFIYAAGQQVASLDHAGKIDVLSRLTGFSNSNAGRGQVQVLAGETLQGVAQRVYGNASLWYILAAANGLTGPEDAPAAGTTLTVPEVRTNRNDAGTFKPYSASEITGPTAPGIPFIPPPPKAGCNPLQIIMIVVAVVVTIYTAGAAAGAMGLTGGATAGATGTAALAGGAAGGTTLVASSGLAAATSVGFASAAAATVGGVVGSVASQLVGKALGVVDSFSLRSAVASGLTAGFTAGLGAAFGGSAASLVADGRWGAAAAQGALASVGGYAANRIAGQEASFSWRAVAASAVSAVANGVVSEKLGPLLGKLPEDAGLLRDTLGNMAGSIVSLHVRRQFGFDDPVNYGAMAVDAFGNALATATVAAIEVARASRQIEKMLRQAGVASGESAGADAFAGTDDLVREQNDAIEGINSAVVESGVMRPDDAGHPDMPMDELRRARGVFATNAVLLATMSGRFADDAEFRQAVLADLTARGSLSEFARFFETPSFLFRGRPTAEQLSMIQAHGSALLLSKAKINAVFADHAGVLLGEQDAPIVDIEHTDAIRRLSGHTVAAIGTGDLSLADVPVFGGALGSPSTWTFNGFGIGRDADVANFQLRAGLASNARAWSAVRERINDATNLFSMLPTTAVIESVFGAADLSGIMAAGMAGVTGAAIDTPAFRRVIEKGTEKVLQVWTGGVSRFTRRVPGVGQVLAVASQGYLGEMATMSAMTATGLFASVSGDLKNGSNHGLDIVAVTRGGQYFPVEVKTTRTTRNWVALSDAQNLGAAGFSADVLRRANAQGWPRDPAGVALRNGLQNYVAATPASSYSGMVVQVLRFGSPNMRVETYDWVRNLNTDNIRRAHR